jgi:hypothetical protein
MKMRVILIVMKRAKWDLSKMIAKRKRVKAAKRNRRKTEITKKRLKVASLTVKRVKILIKNF